MNELFAIVAVALLFAGFGLLSLLRSGCGGPEACAREEGHHGCGACPRDAREGGHV